MTDQTSTGEPTIHPQFCEFLETVYNSGVVPNYTTNGITLAKGDEYTEKLLDAIETMEKYATPECPVYYQLFLDKNFLIGQNVCEFEKLVGHLLATSNNVKILIIDYSKDEQFDTDQIALIIKKKYKKL